ncbi:cupin domain-containing protein [Shewanella sp. KX20019]|uniref:cupin domain-containing protein n=1 Tax=Shewanella sp. KX20019 TaxID=2803864 RepID=UPI0019264F1D|nr:cupin domain-containing protein [Shewanella sp. KX20019]QQX81132.1 cupin domain-containing protein [Shewanella sp. KX20019]
MTIGIDSIIDFAAINTAVERYKLDANKVLQGDPEQQLQNHYSSDCDQFHSGVWQGDIGSWKVNYSEHEYCEILSGASVITDSDGNQTTVKTGDRFVIPAGFTGTWEVLENCRKVYVIFDSNQP